MAAGQSKSIAQLNNLQKSFGGFHNERTPINKNIRQFWMIIAVAFDRFGNAQNGLDRIRESTGKFRQTRNRLL
jgi:hypothetical protein